MLQDKDKVILNYKGEIKKLRSEAKNHALKLEELHKDHQVAQNKLGQDVLNAQNTISLLTAAHHDHTT